jgi:hypothetical protein
MEKIMVKIVRMVVQQNLFIAEISLNRILLSIDDSIRKILKKLKKSYNRIHEGTGQKETQIY